MRNIPDPPSIGKNLKEQRLLRELSLDELSNSSSVSKAMLSQIETGKTNPTIATVWKITHALGLEFNALLKGEEEKIPIFEVTRAHDVRTLETDEEGVHVKVLSPVVMANNLELYMLSFEPGAKLESAPHFSGAEEFLTVISGNLEVAVSGHTSSLADNDFAWYESDVEHAIRNVGDVPAIAHLVVRFESTE